MFIYRSKAQHNQEVGDRPTPMYGHLFCEPSQEYAGEIEETE